ncbi:MAG: zinc-binding dehydrogenase, partial [Pelistega sp.]|nr:zinc-binding dehydrogenase [Pelistega sp.]
DRQDKQPTFGGYSERMVVREKFALHVPENLDLAAAAPLLCAGITVYSPLRHWQVQAGSKVGIIGLGGLGHMAIKLARAMGAEVTLFSRSTDKAEDAARLGAHHMVISTDKEQMKAVANTLDVIIDTVPYQHDLQPYLKTLTLDGTLVLVGLIDNIEPSFNSAPLVLGRRSVAGSLIGGIAETQEMLNFCGQHNIVSDIELIPIQDINKAYERMLKSDVKYRFVIDMASLKQEVK